MIALKNTRLTDYHSRDMLEKIHLREGELCMVDGLKQDLYEKIVQQYQKTKSVRDTAQRCGTSLVTAQRVLITEGLWESNRSKEIGTLWAAGKTLPEIASKLGISENAVRAYLPYSRGKYGEVETADASQSRAYRTRKQKAEENMRQLHQQETALGGKILQFPSTMQQEEVASSPSLSSDLVYRLRLDLVEDFNAKDKAEYLRLSKAKNGISREILVPGDMKLHALHYAIQQLFGWQNSHLHHFSLPQAEFDAVTSKRIGQYFDICGILFRFPDEDPSDRYWDDDYNGEQSIKTWLSKKYTRPFRHLSMTDTLIGAMNEVAHFRETCPKYKDSFNLATLQRDFVFEGDLNALNEGVSLAELLKPQNTAKIPMQLWLRETQQKREAVLNAWSKAPQKKLLEAMTELMTWRSSCWDWERGMWLNPDEVQQYAQETMKQSAEEVILEHRAAIRHWEKNVLPLVQKYRVAMTAQFDTLLYHYDYGDNWMVQITVKDVYHVLEDEVTARIKAVQSTGKPTCLEADGLSLMDDCGGVSGYLEFLRLLDHGDPEEAAESREWAREMGWNGRRKKPENML